MTTIPDLERSPITESIYRYKHKNFSDELIQDILLFTADKNLSSGGIGDGNSFVKDIRDVSIWNIDKTFNKYDIFLSIITEAVFDFLNCKTTNLRVGLPDQFDIEVIQYLRYTPGGHYVPHVDKFYGLAGKHGDRVITVLAYLNDNYAGGHLEFPYLDLAIKPEKGSLIVFPSTWEYCHLVKPVIRGVRHSVVTWFLDTNLQ